VLDASPIESTKRNSPVFWDFEHVEDQTSSIACMISAIDCILDSNKLSATPRAGMGAQEDVLGLEWTTHGELPSYEPERLMASSGV
jgi:hypothetical protein